MKVTAFTLPSEWHLSNKGRMSVRARAIEKEAGDRKMGSRSSDVKMVKKKRGPYHSEDGWRGENVARYHNPGNCGNKQTRTPTEI